jgi:hypothetical protein
VGDFGSQASSLFGIDDGATIGFEYRFSVAKHVEVAAYRTSFNRTLQLYAKYDALHQNARTPVGFSTILTVEGVNNFREQYAPAIGASISRDVANVVALYAAPMWVHNSAAAAGVIRETVMVGLGGSVRVRPTIFLLAEVTPRAGGYVAGDTLSASRSASAGMCSISRSQTPPRGRRSRKWRAAGSPTACTWASTSPENSSNRRSHPDDACIRSCSCSRVPRRRLRQLGDRADTNDARQTDIHGAAFNGE